jgi:hypothetical protein
MPAPSDDEIQRLGEQMDEVRSKAEDDGLLPVSDPEPTLKDPNPDDGDDDPPSSPNPPG